ncbi:MAG TPA: TIGR03915 family putative DNA repair protein, partial [Beijerinckiaceae bacterium]|nr:TIGR03915 family putative DNA repair protein [Beijerinckiaceae bacterium]
MIRVRLAPGADLAGFRKAVRALAAAGAPAEVAFETGEDLFGAEPPAEAPPVALPRPVAELIETVVCHRDPERYALLYDLVQRVLTGERHVLELAHDPLVRRLEDMARTVRREIHKMHAFLRFRLVAGAEPERYAAWFEPEHFVLEAVAPFFVDRFRTFRWSIFTPLGSLHWDRRALTFGPPESRAAAPANDAFEEGWRGYYESTFNPARVNPEAMRAQMPQRYWRNMPEAAAIPELVRSAASRV